MRWLGVDPGGARVGLAICDPEERVAVPLEVVPASAAFPAIRAIVARDGVQGVVVGLARTPRWREGEDEGESAQRSRRLGERIARTLGLPVEYVDEQLTSVEADRRAASAGRAAAAGRHAGAARPNDDLAAALILQEFIDARRDGRRERDDAAR